jgi:hypothetical protein
MTFGVQIQVFFERVKNDADDWDDSEDKYQMTVKTNVDVCEKRCIFSFPSGEHHNVI